MTAGRNKVTEAVEAWRALPESDRAEVIRRNMSGACGPAEIARYEVATALLRAAAEPEVTPLEAMRTRLADGTVRRYAEEAARKAEPEAKAGPRDLLITAMEGLKKLGHPPGGCGGGSCCAGARIVDEVRSAVAKYLETSR